MSSKAPKKKQDRKLSINKETLRKLSSDDLRKAVGGRDDECMSHRVMCDGQGQNRQ
jgi:hypothetical protein